MQPGAQLDLPKQQTQSGNSTQRHRPSKHYFFLVSDQENFEIIRHTVVFQCGLKNIEVTTEFQRRKGTLKGDIWILTVNIIKPEPQQLTEFIDAGIEFTGKIGVIETRLKPCTVNEWQSINTAEPYHFLLHDFQMEPRGRMISEKRTHRLISLINFVFSAQDEFGPEIIVAMIRFLGKLATDNHSKLFQSTCDLMDLIEYIRHFENSPNQVAVMLLSLYTFVYNKTKTDWKMFNDELSKAAILFRKAIDFIARSGPCEELEKLFKNMILQLAKDIARHHKNSLFLLPILSPTPQDEAKWHMSGDGQKLLQEWAKIIFNALVDEKLIENQDLIINIAQKLNDFSANSFCKVNSLIGWKLLLEYALRRPQGLSVDSLLIKSRLTEIIKSLPQKNDSQTDRERLELMRTSVNFETETIKAVFAAPEFRQMCKDVLRKEWVLPGEFKDLLFVYLKLCRVSEFFTIVNLLDMKDNSPSPNEILDVVLGIALRQPEFRNDIINSLNWNRTNNKQFFTEKIKDYIRMIESARIEFEQTHQRTGSLSQATSQSVLVTRTNSLSNDQMYIKEQPLSFEDLCKIDKVSFGGFVQNNHQGFVEGITTNHQAETFLRMLLDGNQVNTNEKLMRISEHLKKYYETPFESSLFFVIYFKENFANKVQVDNINQFLSEIFRDLNKNSLEIAIFLVTKAPQQAEPIRIIRESLAKEFMLWWNKEVTKTELSLLRKSSWEYRKNLITLSNKINGQNNTLETILSLAEEYDSFYTFLKDTCSIHCSTCEDTGQFLSDHNLVSASKALSVKQLLEMKMFKTFKKNKNQLKEFSKVVNDFTNEYNSCRQLIKAQDRVQFIVDLMLDFNRKMDVCCSQTEALTVKHLKTELGGMAVSKALQMFKPNAGQEANYESLKAATELLNYQADINAACELFLALSQDLKINFTEPALKHQLIKEWKDLDNSSLLVTDCQSVIKKIVVNFGSFNEIHSVINLCIEIVRRRDAFRFILMAADYETRLQSAAQNNPRYQQYANSVYNLKMLNSFFKEFNKTGPYKTLKAFGDRFNELCGTMQFNGVLLIINQFLDSFSDFSNFFYEAVNIYEAKIKLLEAMMNDSECQIRTDNDGLKVKVTTDTRGTGQKESQTFGFDFFVELRNEMLTKAALKAPGADGTETSGSLVQRYLQFFELLNELNRSLASLRAFDLPVDTHDDSAETNVKQSSWDFQIKLSDFRQLSEVTEKVLGECQKIINSVNKAYDLGYLFTLLHENMFKKLSIAVSVNDEKAKAALWIQHLMRFLGVSDRQRLGKICGDFFVCSDSPLREGVTGCQWGLLSLDAQIVDEYFTHKRLTISSQLPQDVSKAIYKLIDQPFDESINIQLYDSLIQAGKKENGVISLLLNNRFAEISNLMQSEDIQPIYNLDPLVVYSYHCQSSSPGNFCELILKTSVLATGRFPVHDQILFCSMNTTYHQLRAFLTRMKLLSFRRPYFVAFPERLKEELQTEFLEQFLEIEREGARTCPCIILYERTDSVLINSLSKLPTNRMLGVLLPKLKVTTNIDEAYQSVLEQTRQKVWIARAKAPLTGKTHMIKDKVAKANARYKFIKLTGELDESVIIDSLMKDTLEDGLALHIELGQIERERESSLIELLFSLVFLKVYENKTKVVTLPANTLFFIEFDSSRFERLFSRLELTQPSIGFTVYDPSQDPAPVHSNYPICELFVLATVKRRVNEWIQVKATFDSAKEEEFVNKLRGTDVEAYHKALLNLGIKSKDLDSRPKVVLFESMVVFLAESFLKCSFILFQGQGTNINPQLAAEAILNSIKKLSEIGLMKVKEIGEQQEQWAKAIEHQDSGNQPLAALPAPQLQQPNDRRRSVQPVSSSWSEDIPFMIVFSNDFPMLIYRNPDDIPADLMPRQIMDVFASSHKATHERLFFFLAQMNPRLSVSQYCSDCKRVYHRACCPDCSCPLLTAKDFADTRPVPADFWVDVDQNTTRNSSIKVLWMVECISKTLGFDSNKKLELQNKINKEYQEYCLKCQKCVEKCYYCLDCQTINGLSNERRQSIIRSETSNKEIKWCDKDGCQRLTAHARFCPQCKKLTELSDPSSLVRRQQRNWFQRFIDFFGRRWTEDFSADVEVFDQLAKVLRRRYVLTRDNYVKMLYIYARAKAKTPVVLVGETGCGKTSLVRFLCQDVLDDYYEQFNVHSGTEEAEILKFANRFLKVCQTFPNRDCWLVFDEFNTSSACGLIKTIMADRLIGSEKAPDNALFVATCNPLKVKMRVDKEMDDVGLPRKAGESSVRLTYLVNPIPETLLLYTFNFGHLSEKDEKNYIATLISDNNLNALPKWTDKAIYEMHKVVKNRFDLSATSLRDVRRFLNLFQWFKNDYFKHKKVVLPDEKSNTYSCILAIILCYYFRLPEGSDRHNIINVIAEQAQLEVLEIEKLLSDEKNFVLDQMNLDASVVRNNALSENIFSLFVCLMNRIPIVIVGKPGSSKSLSLQLILEKAKGSNSETDFFKKFPELNPIDYQGSEHSTSNGILKAFETAEKNIGSNAGSMIPVLLFDEIGLAERSKSNPLKVLHSKLEVEQVSIGFVGLSNWFLDASKMNRVLVVLRKDPQLEELIVIAVQMGRSLTSNPAPEMLIIALTAIAKAYESVKRDPKTKEQFSLRDFYALVRYVARNFEADTKDAVSVEEAGRRFCKSIFVAMKRNFNSETDFFPKMWVEFRNAANSAFFSLPESTDITPASLISSNLCDDTARYLLLVSGRPRVHLMVYDLIRNEVAKRANKNYHVMIGSPFPNDRESEDYRIELVGEITNAMEAGLILVMHDLGDVYTSFYDLFNQNFQKFGEDQCCKVVQGSATKGFYVVNKGFKTIVFASREEFDNADPALKSRFEKYYLRESDFQTKEQSVNGQRAMAYLHEIFCRDNTKAIDSVCRVVANFGDDCVSKWLAEVGPETDLTKNDELREHLLSVLVRVANLNFCEYLQDSKVVPNWQKVLETIVQVKSRTIFDLIRRRSKAEVPQQTMVYTFTPALASFEQAAVAQRPLPPTESPLDIKTVYEINLHVIHDQKQLKKQLRTFCRSETHSILVVRVKGQEQASYMYYLQNLISQYLDQTFPRVKHAFIVVHYREDNIATAPRFSVGYDWQEFFIDDLFNPIPEDIKDLVLHPQLSKAIEKFEPEILANFDVLLDHSSRPDFAAQLTTKVAATRLTAEFDRSTLSDLTSNPSQLSLSQNQNADSMSTQSPELNSFLIGVCRSALLANQESSNLTIYSLLREHPSLYTSSLEFVNKINFLITDSYQKKLNSLMEYMENKGLLTSAHVFFGERAMDSVLQSYWISIVGKRVGAEQINTPLPEGQPSPPVGFPFASTEHSLISDYQRANSSKIDDLLKRWDELSANDFLLSFIEKFSTFKTEPSKPFENNTCLSLLLTDLVNLRNLKEERPNQKASVTRQALEELPIQINQQLLQVFLYASEHVCNFVTFITIMYEKLSGATDEWQKCFDVEIGYYMMLDVTSNLLERVLSPKVWMDCWEHVVDNFSIIKPLVESIDEMFGTVKGWKQLKIWVELVLLFKSLNSYKTQLLISGVVKEMGDSLTNVLASPERLEVWMKAIRKSLDDNQMQSEVDVSVMKFEFLALGAVADEFMDNGQNEHNRLLSLFGTAFAQIDNIPGLYLQSEQLFQILVELTRPRHDFERFLKKEEYLQQYLTQNLPELSQDALERKTWLEGLVSQNQKVLPYLLINSLGNFLDKEAANDHGRRQLFSEQFVVRAAEKFKGIKLEQPLVLDSIYALTAIRFVVKSYDQMLNSLTTSGELVRANEFLSDQIPFFKTLQIVTLKTMQQLKGLNVTSLRAYLIEKNQSWMRPYVAELTRIKDQHLSETRVIGSSLYFEANQLFDNANETSNGFENLLSWVKNSRSRNQLLAFYQVLINRFYLDSFRRKDEIMRFGNKVSRFKHDLKKVFGTTGTNLICRIIEGFPDDSKFKTEESMGQKEVRLRLFALHSFAVIASQKYENNPFAHLLFKNDDEIVNLNDNLSQRYMFGMLQPSDKTLDVLLPLLPKLQLMDARNILVRLFGPGSKVYKCSSECDYMFVFEGNGEPVVRPGVKCPLCRIRDVGALRDGIRQDYQIVISVSDAKNAIDVKTRRFKADYRSGHFNSTLDPNEANRYELNVDFRTTILLNLITNGFLLVLNDLGSISLKDVIEPPENGSIFECFWRVFGSAVELLKGLFPDENATDEIPHVLLSKLAEGAPTHDTLSNYQFYNQYEADLQSKLLKQVYTDPSAAVRLARTQMGQVRLSQVNTELLQLLNEEIEAPERYPLLTTLRVPNKRITYDDFRSAYANITQEEKRKLPLTNFLFSRFEEIECAGVVFAYKRFFDHFIEKENGEITREAAWQTSIEQYLREEGTHRLQTDIDAAKIRSRDFEIRNVPTLADKMRDFLTAWKAMAHCYKPWKVDDMLIRVETIQETMPLAKLLLTSRRDDPGSVIVEAMRRVFQVQNELIQTAGRQRVRKFSSWKQINWQSLFLPNKYDIEVIFNNSCVVKRIEYGTLGKTEINYELIERILMDRANLINYFEDRNCFFPLFRYKQETDGLSEKLASLLATGQQIALASGEATDWAAKLAENTSISNEADTVKVWAFLQSIAIPSVVYSKRADALLPLADFVKRRMSSKSRETIPLAGQFNSVTVNKTLGFFQLVESVLFKHYFVTNNTRTRLESNTESPEWVRMKTEVIRKLKENTVFTQQKQRILTALERLILRYSFNADKLEWHLDNMVGMASIWDLDLNQDLLKGLSFDSRLQIRHSLLLRKEFLEEDRQREALIAGLTVNRSGLAAPREELDRRAPITANSMRRGVARNRGD